MEFQGRSRQKPLAMEHLAWDRLIEALKMQSRCFQCVCFSASEESHRLLLAPRLCSFNHIMLVLRRDDIGWGGRSMGLVHRSIIPGRDGLGAPELC